MVYNDFVAYLSLRSNPLLTLAALATSILKITSCASRITTLATCIALLSPEGFGQKVSVGVVAGASPTSAFRDQFFPDQPSPGFTSPSLGERFFSPSKDYIAGGTLEVQFNPSWSVEADGLFRTLHITRAAVLRDGSLNSVSPSPVVT
jgi:hypothetical protein